MLIDLHTHTRPISWDSSVTPDELIERSKAAGIDGVCLTEHDYFWDPEDLRALARRHDYLVLPAIEINTEDGHILVYGIDRYVYGMHRSQELAAHVERAGGVMVAAHPYRRHMLWYQTSERAREEALARASRSPVFPLCVALEKINGRAAQRYNEFAARLCDLLEMPGTAGSDCHNPSDIGRCATDFERDIRDLSDLIEELKAGRFHPAELAPARAR
jgi:predicted metal-dependent phosphoesterase TrpH